MDKSGLTPKQEKYVQELVSGKSQRESYRRAYPASKEWKDTTVDKRASELFNNREVLGRYREVIASSSKMALWTREAAFEDYMWLKNKAAEDIEAQGVRQANSQAFLSALDGMNQLAFRDLELADQKLIAEIKRIQADADRISEGRGTSDKVTVIFAGEDEIYE